MNKIDFQNDTIEELKKQIKKLWKTSEYRIPIVFKAPTGSGKTFMMASVIDELVDDPEITEDKAYIWITFNDELAMQSMNKFKTYFGKTIKHELFTADDINSELRLSNNSILFINWQKLAQNKSSQRKLKLRKPIDKRDLKEDSIYFDDFIDNTRKSKIDIILIIDESHKNATTELSLEIIDYVNPKISINISATPKYIPTIEQIQDNSAGYVSVKHLDVINSGLIREQIILQSKDEINAAEEKDLDLKMLELGLKRREALKQQYIKLGKKINPLMLIQLPNDDSKLKDSGIETKEQIVINFLKSKGVNIKSEVAIWFDNKSINMKEISYLNSEVNFMLFKQAAGTGWDCPRAQVLVMFREIQGSIFYIQTLGRILRSTEPQKYLDYKDYPELRKAYLYTNYQRDEIKMPDGINQLPKIKCTKVKDVFHEDVKDFKISSDYLSRVDYGDFVDASIFQVNFIKSLNNQLNMHKCKIVKSNSELLSSYGIELNVNITDDVITDLSIVDYDKILEEIKNNNNKLTLELSNNDIEKLFNFSCMYILKEQTTEETKVGNIARTWGPLKSALRLWLKSMLPNHESIDLYKIFINDISRGANGKFKYLISTALKEFYPIKIDLLSKKNKKESKEKSPLFTFLNTWCFDENFVEISQKKYLLDNFYLKKEYKGRDNEFDFAEFIDNLDGVEWWYKNGDSGLENFSLIYFNTKDKKDKLFYPDWIIKFSDNRIGIFDTKLGTTLSTEGRARGLQEKIKLLGSNFIGGIVLKQNGVFYYCDDIDYNDISPQENNWKLFI
ncbi:DEAD/DEAH box helicase [Aliarcobacter skirrowii]|uniref:DEAD/DEAH box helicase n=1 Tax=Aliarcobacter skirrowii TaxID=28200 RepID=UPI0029A1196D|nr:DEAD/DEAH box helicase family protein [Aliarcobacter skirrowii]MDX4028292.1 DEAD/DEAH box helicase family protein [Aliarcobacter skirrowii]